MGEDQERTSASRTDGEQFINGCHEGYNYVIFVTSIRKANLWLLVAQGIPIR